METAAPWAVLGALTIARIAAGVQFQSVGAVGPAMMKDLGLAYTSLGTLVGAYSLLGLVLSLPAGWLIARFGARRIVLCGLSLMTSGALLLAVAPGLGVALGGRLISGAGGVLLMVALPTIILSRFDGARLSAAMGTLLAGYPLGIGLGFLLLPAIGSWRDAMLATAMLSVLGILAAASTLPRRSPNSGAASTQHATFPGAKELLAVVVAGVLWGSINAAFTVVLGFGAVFFVDKGLSVGSAGALVSLAAMSTVPVGPLGGWLLGRLQRPLVGVTAGLAIALAATGCLMLDVAPAVLLITVGVALGGIVGPVVALPAAVLRPEHRALGMGFFWAVYFLLLTLLPPLAGLARDLTGVAGAPIYAATLYFGLGLVALLAYIGARRNAAPG